MPAGVVDSDSEIVVSFSTPGDALPVIKFSQFYWMVVATGLLAGCGSVMDRRITAHQEMWRKLPEGTQYRLANGSLQVGDTEEMVRVAYGPPDKIRTIKEPDGERVVWSYDDLDVEPIQLFPHHPLPSSGRPSPDLSKWVTFRHGLVVDFGYDTVRTASNFSGE